MVRVQCGKNNARGEPIGYDLMPLRYGTPRHNEEFTRHDLWVSQSHPDRPMEFIFANLPNIVKDEEMVEEADIVLWCNSAVHHEPRHEDGKPGSAPRLSPGDDAWEGSALIMWSGFDLRPGTCSTGPRSIRTRRPLPPPTRTAISTFARRPRPKHRPGIDPKHTRA